MVGNSDPVMAQPNTDASSSAVDAFFAAIGPSERDGVPPAAVREEAIASSLMSWQRRTVEWAVGRELMGEDPESGVCGGVIAEEMGLGKTLEVMALTLSHPAEGLILEARPGPAHHPLRSGPLWPRTEATSVACNACGRRVQPNETFHSNSEAAERWVGCQACMLPQLRSAPPPLLPPPPDDGARSNAAGKRPAAADEAGTSSESREAAAAAPPKRQRVRFAPDAAAAAGSASAPSAPAAMPAVSSSAASGVRAPPAPAPARRLVLRIRRPLSEIMARVHAAAVAAAAPPPPPPPLPPCAATLVVTPATILPQRRRWLRGARGPSPVDSAARGCASHGAHTHPRAPPPQPHADLAVASAAFLGPLQGRAFA